MKFGFKKDIRNQYPMYAMYLALSVNLWLEPATGKGDGKKDQKGTPKLYPDVTNSQRGESMNGIENKN